MWETTFILTYRPKVLYLGYNIMKPLKPHHRDLLLKQARPMSTVSPSGDRHRLMVVATPNFQEEFDQLSAVERRELSQSISAELDQTPSQEVMIITVETTIAGKPFSYALADGGPGVTLALRSSEASALAAAVALEFP